jgi:hypothetical protein
MMLMRMRRMGEMGGTDVHVPDMHTVVLVVEIVP